MGTKSPGGPQRCRLILKQCLAIQLSKPGHTLDDFWMYDSGYMIFQNFLSANAQCWWNAPLTAATRALRYAGHVAPGMLLVCGEPCALEVVRGAYARSVLKPPATYIISSLGDIEDCIVTPIMQGQFTPLPEALCDVIMDLTADGHSATMENIRTKLQVRFPHMTPPSIDVIYDSLAQLMQEQKIYQTSKGYFILTPERRRSRSRPRSHHNGYEDLNESADSVPSEPRTMLMTNEEALHSLYGEISTERDGDLTHQCIQTNLADVICGGNPSDKILYPRTSKRRSSSFPTPRSLERRHSLRLFGSSKRLQRCASTRSLSKTYAQTLNTDSSSSEYQSTDSSSPKKGSLLSRLFRRSGRNKTRQLETYSAQFPPAEWFNSKAVHLHSVGTQTQDHDMPTVHTLSNSTFYDGSELSQRSMTLPRRHRRNLSSESTFLISSRDCSPIRRRSPAYSSSSLPRSTQSIPATTQNTNGSAFATKTSASLTARTSTPYRSSQKSIQSGSVARHMLEHSPSRSTNSSQKLTTPPARNQDTRSDYRMWQSGPSSLESGKNSVFTSGPSSIDSGKVSYTRTSGHSSLESQRSTSSTVIQPRSIIMLNGSPRGTPRHQVLRARNAEQMMRNQSSSTTPPSTMLPPLETRLNGNRDRDSSHNENLENCSAISNSPSSNSITLKLTTSNDGQNALPNTKIVVQNTPAHSMITFENSKLNENSNVFIINNETTMNEKGQIIRKTLSKQHMAANGKGQGDTQRTEVPPTPVSLGNTENGSNRGSDTETYDSMSYLSSLSSDKPNDSIELPPKPPKNFQLDTATTMNNSRKLCLSVPPSNAGHLIYKNNVLKSSSDSQPSSPCDDKLIPAADLTKANVEMTGSVGNLRFYEKTSKDTLSKTINSNCELNNLRYDSSTLLAKNDNLNSNTSLSGGGSLVQILQKNINSIGSEPNLTQKDTNCTASTDKSIRKDTLDRRLSLSKDQAETAEDLYNFPSLTDLSFNFTSLAAQKILQGVSLNSIDTLVELNMAAAAAAAAAANASVAAVATMEKPQNNQPNPVCTDYGLV